MTLPFILRIFTYNKKGKNNEGFITHPSNVDELAVVWGVMEEEQYIEQVYNHDTGEIYWENPDIEWTDNDDNLIIALLMYGDLEQTIGELV